MFVKRLLFIQYFFPGPVCLTNNPKYKVRSFISWIRYAVLYSHHFPNKYHKIPPLKPNNSPEKWEIFSFSFGANWLLASGRVVVSPMARILWRLLVLTKTLQTLDVEHPVKTSLSKIWKHIFFLRIWTRLKNYYSNWIISPSKKNKGFKPPLLDNGVPATHTSTRRVNGRLISFHLWHQTMSAHGNSILKSSPCCITAWDHRLKTEKAAFWEDLAWMNSYWQVVFFRFIGLKLWKRKTKSKCLGTNTHGIQHKNSNGFFLPRNLSGKNTQKIRAFWFEIVRIF